MKKQKVLVTDLTPSNVFPIRLRILRVWQTGVKIKHIHMVFIDEMNSRIQGSVDKEIVNKFNDFLLEGSTIMLSDYVVAQNDYEFKFANHPYKVKFQPETTVKIIDNFKGSIYGFKFTSFGDFNSKKVGDNEIVDIIGCVVNIGEIVAGDYKGKPNKRRIITLEDLHQQTVECTLWNSFVDEFSSFVKNNEDETNVIIMIMQFGKVREWNDKCSVGNAFFGTRLFINNDLLEINDFKSKQLARRGTNEESIFKIGSISTNIANSAPESFWAKKTCMTLGQIPNIAKQTDCVALATIQNVCTDKPWFYIACQKCARKVKPTDDTENNSELGVKSTWICPHCGPGISTVYPRYKLQVVVVDQTGTAMFVLFDKEVMKCISTSAYQLRGRLMDDDTFPDELEELKGLTLLFDFKVSDFNLENNYNVYTVAKVSNNDSIVQAFHKLFDSNDKPSSSKVVPSSQLTKRKLLLKNDSASSDDSDDSLDTMITNKKQKVLKKGSSSCAKNKFKGNKSNPNGSSAEVVESNPFKKSALRTRLN